jgi:competence protein ComFC
MAIFDKLLSVVAPHECLGCCIEGNILCEWCAQELAANMPSRCFLCKSATEDNATCDKCIKVSRLKNVWVVCPYDGLSVEIIKSLKYERAIASVKPISGLMAGCLPFLERQTTVTYVPTASARVRQRGYDHAQLLSKEIARSLGLKHESTLLRVGKQRQVGATRAERKKQLEGAFLVKSRTNLVDLDLLLVDDVITTGSSLIEVAKVLKKNGARSVRAVAFTQTA